MIIQEPINVPDVVLLMSGGVGSSMLSKEEKATFIAGYFIGTMERDINTGCDVDIANHAGYMSMEWMLDELGLKADLKEIHKFNGELKHIAQILYKEIDENTIGGC